MDQVEQSLASLPEDMIRLICSHLNQSSILSLLRCCRNLYRICRPILYSKINIVQTIQHQNDYDNPDLNPARVLERTLDAQHDLAPLVRDIRFSYDQGCGCADADAARLLPRLPNIQHITVDAAYDEDEWEPDEDGEPGMTWGEEHQRLQALIRNSSTDTQSNLHQVKSWNLTYYDNQRHESDWDIDRMAALFASPELGALAMQHAYHDGQQSSPSLFAVTQSFFTYLKTLVLSQCEIETDALAKMLSFPRALTSFSLGRIAFRDSFKSFKDPIHPRTAAAYVDALLQQSHSLDFIHFEDEFYGSFMPDDPPQGAADLRAFHQLRTLHADIDFLSEVTGRDSDKRFTMPMLPPGLRDLRIRTDRKRTLSDEPPQDTGAFLPLEEVLERLRDGRAPALQSLVEFNPANKSCTFRELLPAHSPQGCV